MWGGLPGEASGPYTAAQAELAAGVARQGESRLEEQSRRKAAETGPPKVMGSQWSMGQSSGGSSRCGSPSTDGCGTVNSCQASGLFVLPGFPVDGRSELYP